GPAGSHRGGVAPVRLEGRRQGQRRGAPGPEAGHPPVPDEEARDPEAGNGIRGRNAAKGAGSFWIATRAGEGYAGDEKAPCWGGERSYMRPTVAAAAVVVLLALGT